MGIKERLEIADKEKVCCQIEDFIKNIMTDWQREGCILGISGGLDSALVAYLAVRAIGKANVQALFMPERDSSKQSYDDARLIAEILGLSMKEISLTPLLKKIGVYGLEPSPMFIPRSIQERYVTQKYHQYSTEEEPTFLKTLKGGIGQSDLQKHIAYYRIKHRLRMVLLYFYGEMNNLLILGTCNKSEKMTGFFVKYGDSASDIDPIADLYKTQVKQLARYLLIPDRIIDKAPTPDLMPGLTDEQAMRISYDKLDIVLMGLALFMDEQDIAQEAEVDPATIAYIKRLVQLSEHMRNLPPHPFISSLSDDIKC